MSDKLYTIQNHDNPAELVAPNQPLVQNIEDVFSMVGIPGVNQDDLHGFGVGRFILNRTNGQMYVCTDATTGFAVWAAVSAAAGQILPADYTPAQTLLLSVANQDPQPQVVADSQFVGRPAGGNLGVITAAQAKAILKNTTEANLLDLILAGTVGQAAHKAFAKVALPDDASVMAAADMVKGILAAAVIDIAGRNKTTDTAANLLAAIPGAAVGTWFEFTLINNGTGTMSLVMDGSVTYLGHASELSINTHTSGTFRIQFTGAATADCWKIGR